MTDLLEIGTIAKAHGLKGDVIVALTAERSEHLAVGAVFETDRGPLVVASVVPHQHRWRVRFEGMARREDAEALHGLVLRAEPVEDDHARYLHSMLDLPVVLTDGTAVGTCVAVIDNPAHDILELDSGALVPLPFVTDVGETIVIDPPEGLFDLGD